MKVDKFEEWTISQHNEIAVSQELSYPNPGFRLLLFRKERKKERKVGNVFSGHFTLIGVEKF